ncbi:hypothetical protein Sme01_02630 [Sphaerisporangium melleum]|uniref:RapZ C-terminal domain-containing protein n=1 Tax=Sphaerisporangium melleum TaxID=321316 RepID=A0A917QNW8_9ACTN|nr:RNase adapter RapZ [Sphaerisporangium melleum]GGK61023.1 hypothetical protein GCM10007964_00170 [Sphaerisporangium melleum]GII67787.1 hypothetical protein Sme01_02630 [Sphaerisporangium melleum]
MSATRQSIDIVSFGYGHDAPPQADATLDARRLFRNPHDDPAMRELTGLDPRVRDHVLATDGVRDAITAAAGMAVALLKSGKPHIVLAVGCGGGRHRAPAIAEGVAAELRARDLRAAVRHRDVDKPVIEHQEGDPNFATGECDDTVT